MDIRIAEHTGYLSILVDQREGAEDAKRALQKILATLETARDRRVLISVRRSDPIFKVESYELSDAILRAAGMPGLQIALVADTPELLASYEYVEVLARQKGLQAKAFRTEADALRWLGC